MVRRFRSLGKVFSKEKASIQSDSGTVVSMILPFIIIAKVFSFSIPCLRIKPGTDLNKIYFNSDFICALFLANSPDKTYTKYAPFYIA